MKRYIRSQTINAWNVGEPSDYDPKTKRSYYSNPKDWKNKLAQIEHVLEPYESHLALGSRSPWGCEIVQKAPKGQHWPRVYKFDYWEDRTPFDLQLSEFTDIAEGIVNPTQYSKVNASTGKSRGTVAAEKIQDFIDGYGFNKFDVYPRTDDYVAIDVDGEDEDEIIELLNRLHAWNLDADVYDHYIEIDISEDDRF